MNASTIIKDDMTLEEKLAAIQEAMEETRQQARDAAARTGETYVEPDPADLTMCEGCQ